MNTLNDHKTRVEDVQRSVRACRRSGVLAKIYHGGSNSTRNFSSSGFAYIDASKLNHIVKIDVDGRYVLAEPNVPFDKLVDATLRFGLIPPMVPEFPGITVGGAVQGGSGESSSFKHGTFHDTCMEYEFVLGDGSTIATSPKLHPDLFWGTSCTFGSLGVMTLLKIKLVPAKSYVHLRYYRTNSHAEAVQRIQEEVRNDPDFVDGIIFSPQHGVVMTGDYADTAELHRERFSRFYDEWFSVHAEKVSRAHEFYEETIPIRDYLFRYDRGGFWVAKLGFTRIPFNRLTRVSLSGLYKTRTLYKLLHGSGYSYVCMTQDICLPENQTLPFLDYIDSALAIYPLWLCPLRPARRDIFSCTALNTDLVINVGVRGLAKPSAASFIDRNRALEKEIIRRGGRKVLYAHAHYTEKEFWSLYDIDSYRRLRDTYHADAIFADLYQKIHTLPSMSRPSRLRGLRALIISPYKRT